MYTLLTHSSSGKWGDPANAAQNWNAKYLMNGLEASQGTYALSDASIKQSNDAELAAAVRASYASTGGTLSTQTAGIMRPTQR